MHVAPRGASVWRSESSDAVRALRADWVRAVIGRIQRSADFERVLRTPSCARSVHFAAHHVGDVPSRPAARRKEPSSSELSTVPLNSSTKAVDESPVSIPAASLPGAWWVGMVVPKRHARRSVTRSLFKRQIRSAMTRHGGALACGLWVIRLRAPFDRQQFPSASSTALQAAARDELDRLLGQAARRGMVR